MDTDTNQFKAILKRKYPNVSMELLENLNEEIYSLNNGTGNLLIRLKKYLPDWIDSTRRRFCQGGSNKE